MRAGLASSLVILAALGCSPPPITGDGETGSDGASETTTGTTTESTESSETTGGDPCLGADVIIEADVLVESPAQLAELDDVIEIRGDLQIRDDAMVELAGLHCLERITGTLTISGNDALERIDDALGRLREITNPEQPFATGLFISQNPELVSLTGLAALERVDDRMIVHDNPALVELRFDALAFVGEHLTIGDAPLASLAGLAALREVGGRFTIANCDELVDLSGLEDLEALGSSPLPGGLAVTANDSLVSLDGPTLAVIPNLAIRGNASLADLGGLEALTSVQTLRIEDNPSLTSLAGLDNLAEVTGNATVFDGISIVRNPVLGDLAGLEGIAEIATHLHICDNSSLEDLSALANLEGLERFTAIYNDSLDGAAAMQLAAAIPGVAWIKVDANGALPPMWWDKPDCPWAGDSICDELMTFQGDVQVQCDQDCCDLYGPTHLCGAMTDGEGRGDCLDEPQGP